MYLKTYSHGGIDNGRIGNGRHVQDDGRVHEVQKR